MPRLPRPHTPGLPHHVISRFLNNERRLCGSEARDAYLLRLGRARRHHAARFLSYALMSTHTHLTLLGEEDPIGGLLHRAHTGFGLWWNQRFGGFGPVVAERPASIVVKKGEELARLTAYQHNNPGRAGLVECPSQSNRTSHRIYIGESPCPSYLEVDWALAAMGFSSTPSGRLAFHDFVCSRRGLGRDPLMSGPGASSIPVAQQLVLAASRRYGIALERLAHPRSDTQKRARLVTIGTGVELVGLKVTHLAAALGLSPQYVSRLGSHAKGMSSRGLIDTFIEGARRKAA